MLIALLSVNDEIVVAVAAVEICSGTQGHVETGERFVSSMTYLVLDETIKIASKMSGCCTFLGAKIAWH